MSDVTDEMVEVALPLMIDVVDDYVWEEDRDRARDAMRAALSAVAPMIAAQERERCARVLEAEGHHIAPPPSARSQAVSDRCEPPAHLRGVDGEHHIYYHPVGTIVRGNPVVARWGARYQGWWADHLELRGYDAAMVASMGWRYLAPVVPPAEVDALRAEVSEWCQKVQLFEDRIHKLSAELAAAREVEQCARDFVAWVTAPANEFTDPENMLVCGEWHGLCAAIKDTP